LTKRSKTLRLRIFAGPNGSGKSTVIQSVKDKVINDRHIDFGIYINADDIARDLKNKYFSFSRFSLNELTTELFINVALASGLINNTFKKEKFLASFTLGHL
jgi:predicted ABC-type ATPase